MGELVISSLVAVAIVAPFAMVLAKQGFPGAPADDRLQGTEKKVPSQGPTGEEYLPGSPPAGPGAERMTDDPPVVEVIADDDH